MDITQILANAQNPNDEIRKNCEAQLEQLKVSNPSLFLVTLARELANNERPQNTRILAGLIVKNFFNSRDLGVLAQIANAWHSFDPAVVAEVRQALLTTLSSPIHAVRHTAAQAVAQIASVDLPGKHWPDLIQNLLTLVTQNASAETREATLECFGFICSTITDLAEINPALQNSISEGESDLMLTAIVQGMRQEEQNNEVKFAASTALLNALEYSSKNFKAENERMMIFKVVSEAAVCNDVRVREVAFQCLVKIAVEYYEFLSPSIMQYLLQLSFDVIKKDDEKVALQGLEFWCTIAEQEIDLRDAEAEAGDFTGYEFSLKFLQFLVPMLCECLVRQEEHQDEDTWNVAMAAGTCLGLLSQAVGNPIVGQVLPFVNAQSQNNENWRFKEAAILAFGSILDGPEEKVLAPIIESGLMTILNSLQHPHSLVKDTASWTIGRICDLHADIIQGNPERYLDVLIPALLAPLAKDSAHICANICWAIHNLAQAFEDFSEAGSGPMSKFFQVIVHTLLQVVDRPDSDENNLRIAAYTALNMCIQQAAKDNMKLLEALVPVFIDKLRASLADPNSTVKGLICSSLQILTQRLDRAIANYSDALMTLYFVVFNTNRFTEEALLACGALISSLKQQFVNYMPSFKPYLIAALQNTQETQTCSAAVGVVGDLARGLEDKLAPYADEIMHILHANLGNDKLSRAVKPLILTCFGDIAMAIGVEFEKYLSFACNMCVQAAAIIPPPEQMNDDVIDYLNQLRESIFDAYTGMIHGLKPTRIAAFQPYVENVMRLVELVAMDVENRSDDLLRSSVGVIGDLASAFKPVLGPVLKQALMLQFVPGLISAAENSKKGSTRAVAKYTVNELRLL
eukprot:GILJ01001353.1.p1 GENE.GILJ01001353.1~~GILJ01001353.1.p1  ORF type:complete len:858 (-),score=174.57 GILJ01001353.1:567-3140(-)